MEIQNRAQMKTRDGQSMAYTFKVARVCHAIHQNPEDVYKLKIKKKYGCDLNRWYCSFWPGGILGLRRPCL